MGRNRHCEDDKAFDGKRYTVRGSPGVAYWVDGWETEPDEDTEWSGYEIRTGMLLVVMVGDDRRHVVDPEDIKEIGKLDYCASCGQMGCTHDGRDRSEENDDN